MRRKIANCQLPITNYVPIYAVILAGGKGKRLRPLSTDARPKAFLSVTRDGKTMFRKTLERIGRLIPEQNIVVVANKAHSHLVKKDFPRIKQKNLILEPISKNTAPAIMLAASILKRRSGDAIMAVLPSDQYIAEEDLYLDSLKNGIEFVEKAPDALLALGIRPTYPATGLGYIKIQKEKIKNKNCGVASRPCIRKAIRFVEKPNLSRAKRFLKDGGYLWNAGAFLFSADSILKAMERFASKIYKAFSNLDDLDAAYKRLPNISIDYAVMEKSGNIFCMECAYGWRDLGTFEGLNEIRKLEETEAVAA